jgi:hypothetical protein
MKKYLLLLGGLIATSAYAQKNFYISPSVFTGKTTIKQTNAKLVDFAEVGGDGSVKMNYTTMETGTALGLDFEAGVELNRLGLQVGASTGTMIVNSFETNFSESTNSVSYNYNISNVWFGIEYALINKTHLRIAPALNSGSYELKSQDPETQVNYMLKNKLVFTPALNIIVKVRRLGIWVKPNYDLKFFKENTETNASKGTIQSLMVSGGVRYYLIREKDK